MAMTTPDRTSNPALSDQAMMRAANELQPGWAAGGGHTSTLGVGAPPVERMTMGGVVSATGVLLALLMVAAAFGWQTVDQTSFVDQTTGEVVNTTSFPGWLFVPMLAAMGVAFLTIFKPHLARFTSPIYALLQGVVLGAISAVYNASFQGIVLQAVLCTMAVFAVMLFLFATRIIKVTEKMRMMIVAATFGVMIVYLATFIFSLFTDGTPAIFEAGIVGIGFSVLVVGIASFNLLLDFDFIERGVQAGLPKGMEWYASFGLILTLVWLYLEILRLLSKLRQ
jgi:uncharacterized YccA/Bax inhibitor family protein